MSSCCDFVLWCYLAFLSYEGLKQNKPTAVELILIRMHNQKTTFLKNKNYRVISFRNKTLHIFIYILTPHKRATSNTVHIQYYLEKYTYPKFITVDMILVKHCVMIFQNNDFTP